MAKMREEGRRKREEGRGKKEEGRRKRGHCPFSPICEDFCYETGVLTPGAREGCFIFCRGNPPVVAPVLAPRGCPSWLPRYLKPPCGCKERRKRGVLRFQSYMRGL